MRESVCLNGLWQFMPDYEGRSPGDAVGNCAWEDRPIQVPSSWVGRLGDGPYQPFDVFDYPARWSEARSGVLCRPLDVSARRGRRAWLVFCGVLQCSAVYINDCLVVQTDEGFLPFEVDITDYLADGGNTLKVWCGSRRHIDAAAGSKVVSPPGSWFGGTALGIWQDVFLEYREAAFVKDVHIVTSVREGRLSASVRAHAPAGGNELWAEANVLAGGTVVKPLGRMAFRSDGENGTLVSFEVLWADAVLWSPENPYLYTLRVRLFTSDALVDEHSVRFGFREFWVEGHCYMLNGQRINFRTDSWHYQGLVQQTREYALNWYRACRDMGINSVRLHAMPYPELYLDVADEVGMLIIDESAIYGSGKAMQADDGQFLQNCREHLEALVMRDRNHPSVVIWSMQNEMRWVDGHDGYKAAMKSLVRAMRALDGTRPISFDGDNRLVDDEDMEIVSMHYNIDGTVADWDRRKPLAFGEHGKFHYISPQVGTEFAGQQAYLSFDRCLQSLGREEALFNEYGRREDVAALSPFNMANYMMHTQPQHSVRLHWNTFDGPGVKPAVVAERSLCVNNGCVAGPAYVPNPAWQQVRRSFQPAVVIADQYDTCFYGGQVLQRSFSVYNDTERTVEARVNYTATLEGEPLLAGSETFRQEPGRRVGIQMTVDLPPVAGRQRLTVALELSRDGVAADCLVKEYSVCPDAWKTEPLQVACGAVFLGKEPTYQRITRLLPSLQRVERLTDASLAQAGLLVIGDGAACRAEEIQPVLDAFLRRGGFALVLEQQDLVLGDVALSGRKFHNAHINAAAHPVLVGVRAEDLQFWDRSSMYDPACRPLAANAFVKPAHGDVDILLECGEGNFGWGGLLWTPLMEYTIGAGRLLLNQLALMEFYDDAPQACLLLRNILQYGAAPRPAAVPAVLLAKPGSAARRWAQALRVECTAIDAPRELPAGATVLADPEALDGRSAAWLRTQAEGGATVVLLPLRPQHKELADTLCGMPVAVLPEQLYQLQPVEHPLTRSLSAFDLYHLERATYAPANKVNSVICTHGLALDGGETLLQSVQNPWPQFFLQGQDGEPIKMAVADRVLAEPFVPRRCGVRVPVGRGSVVLCQLLPDADNVKLRRAWLRLLANVGLSIATPLLGYVKHPEDSCIPHMMALLLAEHQDAGAALAYFTDAAYVLNNLGEGVYGWMKRVEKQEGRLTVPGSAHRPVFLTVFVWSELNRDPLKRRDGELPDSSIVPDVLLAANCATRLFVNGKEYAVPASPMNAAGEFRIADVVIDRGVNRIALACRGGGEDVSVGLRFASMYGGHPDGLKYQLTMD